MLSCLLACAARCERQIAGKPYSWNLLSVQGHPQSIFFERPFVNLRIATAACCLLALTACGNASDTVEQASSTNSSTTAEAATTAASASSLLEAGFGQRDEYASVVAMVKNNSTTVGQTVTVQFNLKDAGGALLASESQVETFSAPNQIRPVQTQVTVPAGKEAATVEATLLIEDKNTLSSEASPEIPAGKVTVSKAEYGTGWSARTEITNPTVDLLKSPRVDVVCRDKAKKITGGAFTFPDLVPPSGKIVVDLDILTATKPVTCDAYASPPVG
ncbi:hypothetical protein AB0J83_03520 [Actinoplanes sp. NPDC049596]|uniref:hypothetical protein n=1 Tax=unclassified Actinoplanes TaxID=2626549 RepID=UPI00342759AC